MPPSIAASMISKDVARSHWSPKVIVPRQIWLTCSPVRPMRRCCTPASSRPLVLNDSHPTGRRQRGGRPAAGRLGGDLPVRRPARATGHRPAVIGRDPASLPGAESPQRRRLLLLALRTGHAARPVRLESDVLRGATLGGRAGGGARPSP